MNGREKNVDKKEKVLVVLSVILVLCIPTFIFLCTKASKESLKREERLLQFVSDGLLDFQTYDFANFKNHKSERITGKRPANPKSIVLLLQSDGEWRAFSLMGASIKEIKTEEDLGKFDIFVFGISQKQNSAYNKYINGAPAGTVNIETEKIDLYYYDYSTKGFFGMGSMPYKSPPEKKRNTEAVTYSLSEIRTFIGNNLRVEMPMSLGSKIVLGIVLAVILGTVVTVTVVIIKKRR